MSAIDALIPIGKAVAELVSAGIFAEEKRGAALDALVKAMKPTPQHAAPHYMENRAKLLGDDDEIELNGAPDSDSPPPPRTA